MIGRRIKLLMLLLTHHPPANKDKCNHHKKKNKEIKISVISIPKHVKKSCKTITTTNIINFVFGEDYSGLVKEPEEKIQLHKV